MSGYSPILAAYHNAVENRLYSTVYSALDEASEVDDATQFRKHWKKLGSYFLAEALIRCAHHEWNSELGVFYLNYWAQKLLRHREPSDLCYLIDAWLEGKPLPSGVSADPADEDNKVRELQRLHSALNP